MQIGRRRPACLCKDDKLLNSSKSRARRRQRGKVPVEFCQICGHSPLESVLTLGYMPPVNQMVPIGEVPRQQPWFPTNLLHCRNCDLVQLGLAVDPVIIFRRNIRTPAVPPNCSAIISLICSAKSAAMLNLGKDDLIIDIGSNDGTLLSNFQNCRPPRAWHRADRCRRHRQQAWYSDP